MVTNAMLRAAAAEAENALLKSLENRTYEPHQFSGHFEKKINNLIRRAKHPIRHQILRTAAAILIAIITLFGAVLATSPEVRAVVVGWVKERFGIYSQYIPKETTPLDVRYDYVLCGIDNNMLLQEIERENGKVFLYRTDNNDMIKFTYTYGADNNDVFLESEGYEVEYVTMGFGTAEVYLAQEEGVNSAIVWKDEEGNAILHISAEAEKETLIRLAESVKREK